MTTPRWVLSLVLLFIFALFIRTIGVEWGATWGDERINFAARVLAGELIPPDHIYPPFNNYLNAVAFAIMFVLGRVLGLLSSASEFRELYFENATPFFIAARVMTSLWAALSAPVGVGIAWFLGLDKFRALLIGLLLAILPVSVGWSHIVKPDVPMATGCLLVALSTLAVLRYPGSLWAAAAVGLSSAVALSFRPSALFFVLPLLVGTVVLEWRKQTVARSVFLSRIGVGFVVGLVSFCIFSIGIVLDLENFLEYQAVQQQIAARQSGLSAFFGTALPMLFSLTQGAGFVLALAFLALPALGRERSSMLLWVTFWVGLVLVVAYAGTRLPPYLLLPFSSVMVILGGVALVRLWDARSPLLRNVGLGAFSLTALLFLGGSGYYLRQALLPSPANEVARYIRENLKLDTKILATSLRDVGVEQSFEARRAERLRHEALAQKYNVELPPIAEERLSVRPNPFDSYYVFPIPWIHGGLQHLEEEDIKVIKPFVWPRQEQEWTLDHWLAKGYEIFIVSREDYYISDERAPAAEASFHREIKARCQQELQVPGRKPFFLFFELRVYRCRSTTS